MSIWLYDLCIVLVALFAMAALVLAIEWNRISVGTKSLLFGVHQFIWHPITVWIAWVKLYKQYPTWRESCCIVFHDWGYWGYESMDGNNGMAHPRVGAELAEFLFGEEYYKFVKYHSRYLAAQDHELPSLLCWPDKFSMMYDPMWFYMLRARISGEVKEYHSNAIKRGFIPPEFTYRQWLSKLRLYLADMSKAEAKHFIRKPHAKAI